MSNYSSSSLEGTFAFSHHAGKFHDFFFYFLIFDFDFQPKGCIAQHSSTLLHLGVKLALNVNHGCICLIKTLSTLADSQSSFPLKAGARETLGSYNTFACFT